MDLSGPVDISEALYSSHALIGQAITRLEELIVEHPDKTEYATRLAGFYRCAGRLDEAAALLRACGPAQRSIRRVLEGQPDPDRLIAEDGPWPYFQLTDWLEAGELEALWGVLDKRASCFHPAQHGREDGVLNTTGHRISEVLESRYFKAFAQRFYRLLLQHAGHALAYFGVRDYAGRRREMQITRHGAGGRYKIHRDSEQIGTPGRRRLTFVYYFHRQPRAFDGGDFILFDKEFQHAETLRYTRIRPLHNSLLLFPSDAYHMVEPVTLEGDEFLAGRFTVNGWIHASKPAPGDPRQAT